MSFTISESLLKLMPIEPMMFFNYLILCHPLLLPHSIFCSIRVFSNESALHIRWPKYWSFSISLSNEYSTLISLGFTIRSPCSPRDSQESSPVFWPGEVHGLYSPWGRKELDMTEQLSLHFISFIGRTDAEGEVPVLWIPDVKS